MKVVFLQDVRNVARKGEVKDVAEGYARNFLLPKKMAKLATENAIKEVETKKREEKKKQEAHLATMKEYVQKLHGKDVRLKSKEKDGKLFGSISAKNIVQKLKEGGISLEEKNVILKEPIKMVGQYPIKIELANGVEARINLIITGEK